MMNNGKMLSQSGNIGNISELKGKHVLYNTNYRAKNNLIYSEHYNALLSQVKEYNNVYEATKTSNNTTSKHTHVSMSSNCKCNMKISKHQLSTFMDAYSDAIIDETCKDEAFGIGEVINTISPVLVDVDISSSSPGDMARNGEMFVLVSEDDIHTIATLFTQCLQVLYRDELKKEDVACVILLKPSRIKDKKDGSKVLKNGFHLHFPNIWLQIDIQRNELFTMVMKTIKKSTSLSPHISSNIETLLDTNHLRKGVTWLMYMSSKSEEDGTYKIYSFLWDGAVIYVKDVDEEMKEWIKALAYKHDKSIDMTRNWKWYIPRALSVIKPSDVVPKSITVDMGTSIQVETPTPVHLENRHKPHKIDRTSRSIGYTKLNSSRVRIRNEKIDEDLSILVGMISKDRASDYSSWFSVGCAIYGASDGNDHGLELWHSFSQQCPEKYDPRECEQVWSKMDNSTFTIGTIIYYARKDSPDKYLDWKLKQKNRETFRTEITHLKAANILADEFSDYMKCACPQKKIWYEYNLITNRWELSPEALNLRIKIDTVLRSIYRNEMIKMYQLLEQCHRDDDDAELDESVIKQKIAQINKSLQKLEDTSFRNRIIEECSKCIRFVDLKFKQKLDSNKLLIGLKDGQVYDMEHHVSRQGVPEDMISKSMNVSYKPTYTLDCEEVEQVMTFMDSVFKEKSIYEFFMYSMADVLIGGNINKAFYIWTGIGNNGKSVVASLFEKLFGEYSIKLPTSLLTQRRGASGSAMPELSRAGGGVRWALAQESDQFDSFNVGIIKELSGNDTFYARDLYSSGSEINPMFTLAFMCNDLPRITKADNAFWNRPRIIPFETVFINDDEHKMPKYRNALYKCSKDVNISDKIPGFLDPLFWLLTHYRKNRPPIIPIPVKVSEACKKYREDNDRMGEFTKLMIDTETANEQDELIIDEIYEAFKAWYGPKWKNGTHDITEMKNYYIVYWGQPMKDRLNPTWNNVKLRRA